MATVLKPKRSFTSAAVPSVSDLEIGELAMNVADGKFFTKLNASTIKEVGGASAVNIQSVLNAGNTTTTDIFFNNANKKITYTVEDLEELYGKVSFKNKRNV